MSGLEWTLSVVLGVLYLALLCTVAILTFRKGHIALALIGIVFPICWLIGAVLPARPGSSLDAQNFQREQATEALARGGAL